MALLFVFLLLFCGVLAQIPPNSAQQAPVFSQSTYTANLPEDTLLNTPLLTLNATGSGNITYGIVENSYCSQVNNFRVDPKSGIIVLANEWCLNFNGIKNFTIKVSATGSNGLSSNATVTFLVQDINNYPPKFNIFLKPGFPASIIFRTRVKYVFEAIYVNETMGDELPKTPVVLFSVTDPDLPENNNFTYRVLNDTFGWDKFELVPDSDRKDSGSLMIVKPLDYEDPQQRYGFNLTIQATDNGNFSDSGHTDSLKLYIKLRNLDDSKR